MPKLGVGTFKGQVTVKFMSETKAEYDVAVNKCSPELLYELLKAERRKGRRIRLPDHPTETSPMGYPIMCYGKASGCSHCVRCIMDYYKEEVEESK